ncbi:MAG: isocitrate lyase/PEP mutase family protein [Caldilineaceae bacterium]|nr:isocitrate lyase/PEP mutase family protein [Caldilineaceae bacterium]
MTNFATKTETFRALHVPGKPFILANAWDIGSARLLAHLGAKAIATSSAAHAFTLGLTDGEVTRDQAVAHAQALNLAVDLPVSGDFEHGYGHDTHSVVTTINAAIAAGLAGCCIEDTAVPDGKSYGFGHAVARIEAAVDAIRQHEEDFVLTARADGVLRGNYNTDEAIRRLQAFEAAGADVLYAPFLPNLDELARLCRAVKGPVNVLCAGPFTRYTVADFANAGVARISLGSSLSAVTRQVVTDVATTMFTSGDLSLLGKVQVVVG